MQPPELAATNTMHIEHCVLNGSAKHVETEQEPTLDIFIVLACVSLTPALLYSLPVILN